jgi:hypothetical protein
LRNSSWKDGRRAVTAALGRLLLVLYAAWIGQYLGDQALDGYLSGFVGASVMTPAVPAACIPER